MRRRDALLLLGSMPFASYAQRRRAAAKVGFLYFASQKSAIDSRRYPAFVNGMAELGYVEGRNLLIEARFAEGKAERLPLLVAELVRAGVEVIVAGGNPAIHAANQSSAAIPVVIAQSPDPVSEGWAKTLARPGGKVTGLTSATSEIEIKMLEFLRAAVPGFSRLAVLSNPTNRGHAGRVATLEAAAKTLGTTIVSVIAQSPEEIEAAFQAMTRQRVHALIVLGDTYFLSRVGQIATLALRNRLPSAHTIRDYTHAGGLMAYGPDIPDNFRRAATYVDRILKGARPGDLPIERPTRFELTINLKAARDLGLTIPKALLFQADTVIE